MLSADGARAHLAAIRAGGLLGARRAPWTLHVECYPIRRRPAYFWSTVGAIRHAVSAAIRPSGDGFKRLPRSRFRLVGRWRDANGVVHARPISGRALVGGSHARGLRCLCMRPWKHCADDAQPASPEGLCRADLLDFSTPITCERCQLEVEKWLGVAPPVPHRYPTAT